MRRRSVVRRNDGGCEEGHWREEKHDLRLIMSLLRIGRVVVVAAL